MKKGFLTAIIAGAVLALAVPVYGDSVRIDYEPLVLNSGWVEAFLAKDEAHFFPIELTEPGRLKVRAQNFFGSSILSILDEDYVDSIYSNGYISHGSSGSPATLDIARVLMPGTYYVRMKSGESVGDGEGNYRIKVEFEAYPNNEIEPNNEYKEAQRIDLGTMITGVSAMGEPHDYYYFEVPERQEIRIVFNAVQERISQESFRLYDEDLIMLIDTGNTGEVFNESLDPGIYYIDITWRENNYGYEMAENGSYTIKLGDTKANDSTAADSQTPGTQMSGGQAAGDPEAVTQAERVTP